MQEYIDQWLRKYYPRLDIRLLARLLQDVREKRLPVEEFKYLVLGCGVLFYVRPLDPEHRVKEIAEHVSHILDPVTAEVLLNKRAIRHKVRQQGLVIGPEQRPLSIKRKQGQIPNPAPRIAALNIGHWVLRKRPDLDHVPWACDLYQALKGQSIQRATYARWEQTAERAKVTRWDTDGIERKLSAIAHLVRMFENRYERFKNEGRLAPPIHESPTDLYPIGGVLDSVLEAIEMEILPEEKPSVQKLFGKSEGKSLNIRQS